MTSIAAKMLLEELKPKELVVSQDLLSSHPNLRDGFIVPKAVGPGKTFVSTNPKTFKMINVRLIQTAAFLKRKVMAFLIRFFKARSWNMPENKVAVRKWNRV